MDDQIEESIKNERMIEVLALVFGGLAALLAGVGIYGVLAYTTMQRTREIGIRIALGSTRLAISGLVLKEMLRLGAVGVLVAVPCAVLLGRALHSQLFGVSAADPVDVGRRGTTDGTCWTSRDTAASATGRERATDGGAPRRIEKPRPQSLAPVS